MVGGHVVESRASGDHHYVRFWNDGRVDVKRVNHLYNQGCLIPINCESPAVTIFPSSCPGDFSPPNGEVDISDLLGLLANWGPCPILAME